MDLVRVNHRNGLYLEFLFMDPGRAKECAEVCAKAKLQGNGPTPQPSPAHVFDDAGREGWLDGREIINVQLVNLETEVILNTRLRAVAEDTAAEWLKSVGITPTPPPMAETGGRPMNGDGQPYRPVIGTSSPQFQT